MEKVFIPQSVVTYNIRNVKLATLFSWDHTEEVLENKLEIYTRTSSIDQKLKGQLTLTSQVYNGK